MEGGDFTVVQMKKAYGKVPFNTYMGLRAYSQQNLLNNQLRVAGFPV